MPGHVELRLLLFGCLEHSARALLWWLAKLEADPDWRRDLLAAAEPWEFHFEHIAAMPQPQFGRRSVPGHPRRGR